MEDRSGFTARLVTVGPLDGCEHVGWAADGSGGDGPHLILMRDQDGLCVVSGDSDTHATHYGGVLAVEVTETLTTLRLTPDAAADLGLLPKEMRIAHGPDVLDAARVRRHLARLL